MAVPCPCCSSIAAHTGTVCPTTGFKITNPALSRENQAICLYCTVLSGLLPHPSLHLSSSFTTVNVYISVWGLWFLGSHPVLCCCSCPLLVFPRTAGAARHLKTSKLRFPPGPAGDGCTPESPQGLPSQMYRLLTTSTVLPSFHLSPLSQSIQGSSSNIPGRRISEGPL